MSSGTKSRAVAVFQTFERGLGVLWGLTCLAFMAGLIVLLAGDWLSVKFRDGEPAFEDAQGWTKLCFYYFLAFGAGLAVIRMEHLRVDFLEQVLRPRARGLQVRLLLLLSALASAWMFHAGLAYHQRMLESGLTGFGDTLPVTHGTLSFLVAMGLCSFHFLLKIFTWVPETGQEKTA